MEDGRSVLIVDDEPQIAELIDFTLSDSGYKTHCVSNGTDAIEYVRKNHPHLVVLDIRLPDVDGLEVLRSMRQIDGQVRVLMITAHGTIKLAIETMKLGACDFIEKPFSVDELEAKVKQIFEQSLPAKYHSADGNGVSDEEKFQNLMAHSIQMARVIQGAEAAARSNVNVLITGESGTGKEIVARAIHFRGLRKMEPFVAVNCSAIPEMLLESELYGHEKGSFTGAVTRKIGKFEQAKAGTIFLDEIGDLTQTLQVKLLRALQERVIERVGGSEGIKVNARFITATNRNLLELVRENKFREDLYYRINVFHIHLLSLRDRREDIPNLLKFFIKMHSGGERQIEFTSQALAKLTEYEWPGNIRELENFVERTLLLKADQNVIDEQDVESLSITAAALKSPELLASLDEAEKTVLENAVLRFNGNITRTCQFLHISRDTFYRKMKKYSIKVRRFISKSDLASRF